MRILVTGAAGFIGTHVVERLLARGDTVVGLDAFDNLLYPAVIKRRRVAPLLGHGHFRFLEADVRTATTLEPAFEGGIDAVLHLAGLAGVRTSLSNAALYESVNATGTGRVLDLCATHGVRRFVFASSSSVYGARPMSDELRPFREEDVGAPRASPYAESKYAAEILCEAHARSYAREVTVLRLFTVYGPRQRPDMALQQFARRIEEGRPVPLFGEGRAMRDFTFVDDAVSGILAALDAPGGPPDPGGRGRYRVYNIGGGRPAPVSRVVEILASALGRTARVEFLPMQAGDVPYTLAAAERALADLGWCARMPLEEGLHRFVEWYRSDEARAAA